MTRLQETSSMLKNPQGCRGRARVLRALVLLACLVILAVPVDAAAQTLDERLQRGQQLLQEGQFEQALAELQQVIDDSPNSAAALYYAGRALGRLQRFDESFDYLVRASELDPGNGPIHQAACIAAAQGGRFEDAWNQGILAAQSGVEMSSIFSQIETASPRPDDFEARLAVPRVLVAELDLSRIRTADLQPDETEFRATAVNQALTNIPEIRRQFALGLLRSQQFAVVKQVAQATYVLLIQADSFDGETIDGYVHLADPTSGDEQYTRRMTLEDITSVGAVRKDVAVQLQYLEAWIERERHEQGAEGR